MTQEKTQTELSLSKVDTCPVCMRRLTKRKKSGDGMYIDFQHKGSRVLTAEAIIRCIGCKRNYHVIASKGIMNEVKLESDGN